MQIIQDPRTKSKASDCIYVWNESKKEMTTHYIPRNPFSIHYKNIRADRAFAASSGFMHIESFLKYFHSLGGIIGNPSVVRDYLYRYPELINLAQYCLDLALQRFSPDLELFLDMYQDREAQFERLMLYVRLSSYDKNTMKIIKRIRKDYHQLFPDARGRFLLTTDFHFPG